MNKLRAALQIVEDFDNERSVEIVFTDGVIIRYKNFEVVDETIYNSKDFCVAEMEEVNGIERDGYVEFNINEIIKVVDTKNSVILWEKTV
jgi:hypothetical protein